jgi:hypothetical protein
MSPLCLRLRRKRILFLEKIRNLILISLPIFYSFEEKTQIIFNVMFTLRYSSVARGGAMGHLHPQAETAKH